MTCQAAGATLLLFVTCSEAVVCVLLKVSDQDLTGAATGGQH